MVTSDAEVLKAVMRRRSRPRQAEASLRNVRQALGKTKLCALMVGKVTALNPEQGDTAIMGTLHKVGGGDDNREIWIASSGASLEPLLRVRSRRDRGVPCDALVGNPMPSLQAEDMRTSTLQWTPGHELGYPSKMQYMAQWVVYSSYSHDSQ